MINLARQFALFHVDEKGNDNKERERETSGARETGKATVRDWAREGGAWHKREKERAAETPNPKALLATDSRFHPALAEAPSTFNLASSRTSTDTFLFHVVGNHNRRGNTPQLGFPTLILPGIIVVLTSIFWQRLFIFIFLYFLLLILKPSGTTACYFYCYYQRGQNRYVLIFHHRLC